MPEQVLRRLEWTVIRRLDGLLQGDYRTLFRGFGLDLADLREYQYHDDVRHIDWNVTARLQTPLRARVQRGPRGRPRGSCSTSARRSTSARGEVRKRAVSAEFVAVLARLLTRHGNRVGALFYGDEVDTVIPARSGRRHVLHMLHAHASRGRAPQLARRPTSRELLRSALRDRCSAARWCSSCPISSASPAGSEALGAARAAPRGGRGAAATIRWSWSCPTSAC